MTNSDRSSIVIPNELHGPQSNGTSPGPHPPVRARRRPFGQFLRQVPFIRRFGGAAHEPPPTEDEGIEGLRAAPGGDGLHGILKSPEHGFAIEVGMLEKEAREQGASWAQAGLPRQDTPADQELPVETTLRRRALDIFVSWVQQVQVRVQDAIEHQVQIARGALSQIRHVRTDLARSLGLVQQLTSEVDTLQQQGEGREAVFGYRPYFRKWLYLLVIVLVAAIDWVANVPVFQELLPADPTAQGSWEALAAQAERYGIFSGLMRVVYRMIFNIEVSLFTMGVVILLILSGHFVGGALRRVVGVRERDRPEARRSIAAHRREHIAPLILGLVAGALIITFLGMARAQITDFAQGRFEAATAARTDFEQDVAAARAAGDIEAMAALESRRPRIEAEIADLTERARYSQRIAETNVAITLINCTLFLIALIGGYLVTRDRIVSSDPENPRVAHLRQQLDATRAQIEADRRRLATLHAEAQTALSWAEFLAASRPFGGWEAKRERLERSVALFRAENARLRGVDPHNITAFRSERGIDVDDPAAAARFQLPPDFGEVKTQLEHERTAGRELDA